MTSRYLQKSKKPSPKRKSAKPAKPRHIEPHAATPAVTPAKNLYGYDDQRKIWGEAVPEPKKKDWQLEHPIITQCLPWLMFALFFGAGLIGYAAHG